MSYLPLYKNLSQRLQQHLKAIKHNGLPAVVGLLAFSLFFVVGLVTLGACLLVGLIVVAFDKWQQRPIDATAEQPDKANSATNDHSRSSDEPVAAV
ncbi:hypothetical protein [Ferrimonas lipolytica]|uniref:Uncharacterized protein n=1 Tax=Ferrimonas lipolytica TaxID=2724191 RepID=A0A6H1UDR1_9GAMM|nr:hypothetical protein [Ferrimonas lipolytica]QIZ76473.1 hypothetical protein HER31_06110 [Ferrimonas lipolytica]